MPYRFGKLMQQEVLHCIMSKIYFNKKNQGLSTNSKFAQRRHQEIWVLALSLYFFPFV